MELEKLECLSFQYLFENYLLLPRAENLLDLTGFDQDFIFRTQHVSSHCIIIIIAHDRNLVKLTYCCVTQL